MGKRELKVCNNKFSCFDVINFHESRFEMHVNKFVRSYFPSKAIRDEFRRVIIERTMGGGGIDALIAGGGAEIDALITLLCVDSIWLKIFTLNKIWTRFCKEYSVTAYAMGDSIQGKLSNDDLELIFEIKHLILMDGLCSFFDKLLFI